MARTSRFALNVIECADWRDLTCAFDQHPAPVLRRDDEGEVFREGWLFRGHKRESYPLEPSIERAYPSGAWAEAEYRILREFQAKAPMHMDPAILPPTTTEHKLSWLALMQHYGAPTRLLDFTYSPYVALYFALRHRTANDAKYAEVWALDLTKLSPRMDKIGWEAERAARKGEDSDKSQRIKFGDADTYASSLQLAQEDDERWETIIQHALNPTGRRRRYYERNGMVGIALPPVQNLRLSSQQGVFMFNAAEDLAFEASLERMMHDCTDEWYRRYRIPANELPSIEERLFSLNIHDLSLFPDAEGLAGFVRQKLRLHW